MAERTEVALQKQLTRELRHSAWLTKNLAKTQATASVTASCVGDPIRTGTQAWTCC